MARDFVYLVAVIDWYTRKVMSWRLSNTLTTDFCVEALEGGTWRTTARPRSSTRIGLSVHEEFTSLLKQCGLRSTWTQGSLARRSVRRTLVEIGEVRRGPSARVRERERGAYRSRSLLPVLQRGAAARQPWPGAASHVHAEANNDEISSNLSGLPQIAGLSPRRASFGGRVLLVLAWLTRTIEATSNYRFRDPKTLSLKKIHWLMEAQCRIMASNATSPCTRYVSAALRLMAVNCDLV